MRRLLALGLGCLASFTASSEDLLTIFDQAVVNDPTVREAEFTRQATREARPQAWAAYLPQITGNYNKGENEGDHRQQAHDDCRKANCQKAAARAACRRWPSPSARRAATTTWSPSWRTR